MFQFKKLATIRSFRSLRTYWGSYIQYRRDWHTYSHMIGAEILSHKEDIPNLYDRTSTTTFDTHYFYQSVWAAQAIEHSGTPTHVDVGSLALYVGMLSAFTQVTFIDIRPLPVTLKNFDSRGGNILELPYASNSVHSLSCLHVAEHIGLGRYGDPLDPGGTRKAVRELARILAYDGNLYFSLPIGKPRVCFNAHRIHSPDQIMEYFHDLTLVSFAAVDDSNVFVPNASPNDFTNAKYACGMFHFTKKR